MFIKWDRFLGKFKKGPPHIGEYEKKVHFRGGRSPMVLHYALITEYKYIIQIQIQNTKYEKYENTSRKNKILLYIWSFYIILGTVTS